MFSLLHIWTSSSFDQNWEFLYMNYSNDIGDLVHTDALTYVTAHTTLTIMPLPP